MKIISLLTMLVVGLFAFTAQADDTPKRSGFVSVPGGPVWYEVMGQGDGIPLIYLHGGPGGTSCWMQMLAPLGDERPVIRYDQLGSGRSGRPTDTTLWNRDRFVLELDALRTELGLKEIHLGGHSWGGSLAAYYFLETGGDGIHSLILSSPLLSTPAWIEDTNYLRTLLPEDVQAVLTEHEAAGTTDSIEYADASDVFYAEYMTRGEAVETYDCPDAPWNPLIYEQMWGPSEFHAPGSLTDFDLTPRLSQLGVPTLFITGEFDEARPVTVARFAAAVPDAQMEVLPGVGHAGPGRLPDLYRDILRSFLHGVEAADAMDEMVKEDAG